MWSTESTETVISSCSDSTPVDSTPVLQFNYYNYLTSQVKGIVLSKTAVTADSSCVSGVPRPPALLTDYKFRSSHDPLRFDHLTHRAQQNTIFAIVVVCLFKDTYISFLMFIFDRERKREHRGGAERGGDTELEAGSRL